jgi:hypothetical protein
MMRRRWPSHGLLDHGKSLRRERIGGLLSSSEIQWFVARWRKEVEAARSRGCEWLAWPRFLVVRRNIPVAFDSDTRPASPSYHLCLDLRARELRLTPCPPLWHPPRLDHASSPRPRNSIDPQSEGARLEFLPDPCPLLRALGLVEAWRKFPNAAGADDILSVSRARFSHVLLRFIHALALAALENGLTALAARPAAGLCFFLIRRQRRTNSVWSLARSRHVCYGPYQIVESVSSSVSGAQPLHHFSV